MSEEVQSIQVDDVVAISLDQFAGLAWQKMGLQPDPMSHKIEIDLAQAQKAIDVAAALADFLEGSLGEEDRREVHNLIRNLRLNYVQKTKEGHQ